MIKTILLVRRRADLTIEQFRDHYENRHAPLAVFVLPTLRAYVRNYPDRAVGEMPWFDVMTEFWFDDDAGWEAARDFAASEEGKILAEDEARFMDRSSMVSFIVREEKTSFAGA